MNRSSKLGNDVIPISPGFLYSLWRQGSRRGLIALAVVGWLVVGVCGDAAAQVANARPPTKITYQGFLTDQNGLPLGNVTPINKTIIFRVYDALTGGTLKWSSQQTVTIDKGHFSVLLGEGSQVGSEPFDSDLSTVFAVGSTVSERYLELSVDSTAITPRLQFLSAPYAMMAKRANNVDVVDSSIVTGYGTFANILTVNGNGSYIQLGADVAGREGSAGQIAYGRHSGGTGLDIVGAGSSGATRKINMWAEGGMTIYGGTMTVHGNITATGTISGNGTIPLGGIIMWSGTDAEIPSGWALCNGQTVNGRATPDLRNRFVIGSGAGSSYGRGATGGNSSINLTASQMPSHAHSYEDAYFAEAWGNGAYIGPGSGDSDNDNRIYYRNMTTAAAGSGSAVNILPPYYALAFIMRVY